MSNEMERLRAFARDNRRNMPKGEVRLWIELRGRRLGYKFRRQHIIGSFIADFVCLERRLVVEVDGRQHTRRHDLWRQEQLEAAGFRVLRFWSDDVLDYTRQVVKEITAALDGVDPDGKSVEAGGQLVAREHEALWPE